MRMPSGYFQAKADIKTGNVMGRYYNTQTAITCHCPQEILGLHDTKDARLPYTNLDTYLGQMRLIKSETSTPTLDTYQLEMMPEQNNERP